MRVIVYLGEGCSGTTISGIVLAEMLTALGHKLYGRPFNRELLDVRTNSFYTPNKGMAAAIRELLLDAQATACTAVTIKATADQLAQHGHYLREAWNATAFGLQRHNLLDRLICETLDGFDNIRGAYAVFANGTRSHTGIARRRDSIRTFAAFDHCAVVHNLRMEQSLAAKGVASLRAVWPDARLFQYERLMGYAMEPRSSSAFNVSLHDWQRLLLSIAERLPGATDPNGVASLTLLPILSRPPSRLPMHVTSTSERLASPDAVWTELAANHGQLGVSATYWVGPLPMRQPAQIPNPPDHQINQSSGLACRGLG